MRELTHEEGKEVIIQHDWDFCSKVYYKGEKWPLFFFQDEKGNFTTKHYSDYNDWYIQVAIEKLDKIKENRHLINSSFLLSYRWAIREGFNHQLDTSLQKAYDSPNNRNNIKGVQAYIDRIKKASDEEMKGIINN